MEREKEFLVIFHGGCNANTLPLQPTDALMCLSYAVRLLPNKTHILLLSFQCPRSTEGTLGLTSFLSSTLLEARTFTRRTDLKLNLGWKVSREGGGPSEHTVKDLVYKWPFCISQPEVIPQSWMMACLH